MTRSSLARCKRSGLSGNVVKIRTCCGSQSRAPDRGSVTRGDADVATVLRVGDPRSGGSGKMRPKCIGKKNYLGCDEFCRSTSADNATTPSKILEPGRQVGAIPGPHSSFGEPLRLGVFGKRQASLAVLVN